MAVESEILLRLFPSPLTSGHDVRGVPHLRQQRQARPRREHPRHVRAPLRHLVRSKQAPEPDETLRSASV